MRHIHKFNNATLSADGVGEFAFNGDLYGGRGCGGFTLEITAKVDRCLYDELRAATIKGVMFESIVTSNDVCFHTMLVVSSFAEPHKGAVSMTLETSGEINLEALNENN